MGQGIAVHGEGVSQVGRTDVRLLEDKVLIPIDLRLERRRCVGREQKQLGLQLRLVLVKQAHRLAVCINDDLCRQGQRGTLSCRATYVCIRAANAKGIDADALGTVRREGRWLGWHPEALLRKRDFRRR